jgi:hypothetical protein
MIFDTKSPTRDCLRRKFALGGAIAQNTTRHIARHITQKITQWGGALRLG